MVHRPVSPGPLKQMCLRLVSQATYSYLDAKPRLEKYFQLCGPHCNRETIKLIEYIKNFFPTNLRELLLEFLIQLWFSKLLKMKQKTIDHERMSAGDPHHDHATCGGTTAVGQAQKQTDLLGEILSVAMTKHTKSLRIGFTNARSGQVKFCCALANIEERCHNIRHLDLTFATDTLLPTKPSMEPETFNMVYAKDCLKIVKQLAVHNNISTLKLMLCTAAMLQEIAKCSKLSVLEIIEASLLKDTDLATFSQGSVRHNLSVMKIKFWSDTEHINTLCETQTARKMAQGMSQHGNGRLEIPGWAVFLLNCPNLTSVSWFGDDQPRPFNPCVGLLTLIREARKWWTLEIDNEGDLLDIVLETPQDLDSLRFKWSSVTFHMGNDGIVGSPSETGLNTMMEGLDTCLTNLTQLSFVMFPNPLDFHSLDGLISTPAGQHIASRLKKLEFKISHPSHLTKISELLVHTKQLESLTIDHLQPPNPHAHPLVVNLDVRDVLNWMPATVDTLKIKGFHLVRRVNMETVEGQGPTYPGLRTLTIVFCGTSDRDLLHLCCMCPRLEHVSVVVSITNGPPSHPPQPPQHGLVATHLHSLCHNSSLVTATVLVKVGEGWIQIDDREMLGELVLGSTSEHLRKLVLFPIRGICGGGLRSLVRAAKEKNICLNIGIGNQRPVKTETNRRTATDNFTLISDEDRTQNYFLEFGEFLDKKISEFEGQFWNDPDWFYGGMWPESGVDLD